MGEERDETGNWGQKLLAYRLRASMSQEDLARVTGLSVRGIRLIENGHRRPRASTVTILTEGLRLSEAETVAVVEAVRPQSRVNGPPAAAVTAMPIPRQLPAPPKGLVGRDADLAVLDDELVSADNPLCLIVGPGGIGKTWLAVHWANLHRDRFPDGQLYVNLRGFDPEAEPITPLNALRSILTALGIPAAGTSADVDDLAALYRSVIAELRLLVLLDNAFDASQVVPLLPGGGATATVITSRNSLRDLVASHGARVSRPGVLSSKASRRVLAKRLGARRVGEETDAVTALVKCCGGLPLALGIVAAHAARYPEHPLQSILDGLEADGSVPGADEAVRRAIDGSLRSLDIAAVELFALLGLVSGGGVDIETVASLAGGDHGQVRRTLRMLEDANLLERDMSGRYQMHDVTHRYAVARSQNLPDHDRTPVMRRLVEHYVTSAYTASEALNRGYDLIPFATTASGVSTVVLTTRSGAIEWVRRQEENLLRAQRTALDYGWFDLVWRVVDALRYFWEERAFTYRGMTELCENAVAAGDHLGPSQKVRALRSLALTRALPDGGGPEDVELLREALDICENAPCAGELAPTNYSLAHVLTKLDRNAEALDHARMSLANLGEDETLSVARSHLLNCWVLSKLGRFDEALDHGGTALRLAEGQRFMQARIINVLGMTHHKAGRYPEAVELLERAEAQYRDLDGGWWRDMNLEDLGTVLLEQGRRDEAAAVWGQSAELSEKAFRLKDARRVRAKLSTL